MSALEDLIVKKRLEVAGRPGIRGLIANGRTFSLAIFASLGGLVYGYNQGMFGQVLSMTSFQQRIGANEITNPVTRGLLTAILELGAWIGVLCSGYLADKLGRRWNMIFASGVFTIDSRAGVRQEFRSCVYLRRTFCGRAWSWWLQY